MSNDELKRLDNWLVPDGAAAVTMRERLLPADGADGVIFPPTFAASAGQPEGGYNIDDVGPPGSPKLLALIDSVGSQANRIEPLFKRPDLRELVPQITIKAGSQVVNLLDAGHRAGDAIVRYSALGSELAAAFAAWQKEGNAEPLAKVAPTSLVFGVWDSRDTQAKVPRILASTIRAYEVKKLKRSAQYVPPVDYVADGLVASGDRKDNDALSALGFQHAPAAGTHGGVIVEGEIRRDVVLSLAGLRVLSAGSEEATMTLRRYVLGLALVGLTAPRVHDLRQGCLLVPDPDRPAAVEEVGRDGKRTEVRLEFTECKAYAQAAAAAFGVGASREVAFDPKVAATALKKQKEPKAKG